jgi:molybdopterin-biosynthesis enzyme MoeA-like protein
MPGFPEMSHPMVTDILEKLIPHKKEFYRNTLTAQCKENEFIEIMEKMPKAIEVSSLPKLCKNRDKLSWQVTISLVSENKNLAKTSFNMFVELLNRKNIAYSLQDEA